MQRLLAELIPGGAKRDVSALQAKRLLAAVRPTATTSRPGGRGATDADLGTLPGWLRGIADLGRRNFNGLLVGGPLRAWIRVPCSVNAVACTKSLRSGFTRMTIAGPLLPSIRI